MIDASTGGHARVPFREKPVRQEGAVEVLGRPGAPELDDGRELES